jgi:hypothetical protein
VYQLRGAVHPARNRRGHWLRSATLHRRLQPRHSDDSYSPGRWSIIGDSSTCLERVRACVRTSVNHA